MVSNASNALYEVKKTLYCHYRLLITKEWWVDKGRKAIIQERSGVKMFVLFKRDFFNSYGKIAGVNGIGESINVDDFEYAVYDRDISLFLYIYPSNKIYKIRSVDIKRHSIEYVNEADNKRQYLFSVKRLQPLWNSGETIDLKTEETKGDDKL